MNKFKKIMAILFAIMSICSHCLAAEFNLITEQYIVQENDTLESIAEKFIVKNTYGERNINEFIDGIREANWKVIKNGLEAGQTLIINYWVEY